ncbi:MAG TPA: LLM class flavin-dependent oxidoreductase [Chloroflexota bacterium]|nr:LLM class flavin-dependent oxidoreductase [Chloroflexota bacterium]
MKFAAYAMPSYQPEFGLTQGEFMRATLEQLVAAEGLGFDSVWVNEHHFHRYGGMMPALPTMLAALAQRTSGVRLGTSVVLLPLHHPVQVAEELAMVDLLSNGRLELGIGRGFVAHDYEVMGVDYAEAQERLFESLEVILKAWSGEPFTHEGKYFHLSNLEVWPVPEQRPHPPIWMAASNSPASFEHAGAHGYKLLTIGYIKPIAALAELTCIYRDAYAAAGWPKAPAIGTHYHTVVAEDRAEARRIAEAGIAEHVRLNRESRSLAKFDAAPPSEPISIERLVDEGRLIAGDPDDCARTLKRFADEIGCTETHCLFQFGNIPFPVAQRSMELFAAEVMPRLQASLVAS